MPQLEKNLHGDLDEINRKIGHGVCSICSMTTKRGTWDTTLGDVRCLLTVFEKHAPKEYVGAIPEAPAYPRTIRTDYSSGDYKDGPHYSMAVTLLGKGDEVRICAITSGSGNALYFLPFSGAEYELYEALDITLNQLDNIII